MFFLYSSDKSSISPFYSTSLITYYYIAIWYYSLDMPLGTFIHTLPIVRMAGTRQIHPPWHDGIWKHPEQGWNAYWTNAWCKLTDQKANSRTVRQETNETFWHRTRMTTPRNFWPTFFLCELPFLGHVTNHPFTGKKSLRTKKFSAAQRWMNCMELMAPRKKTVGTSLVKVNHNKGGQWLSDPPKNLKLDKTEMHSNNCLISIKITNLMFMFV